MSRADVFRPKYRELKPNEVQQVARIKTIAAELLAAFTVGTRESALATTKLEEAVMWAVKGVTA